jgi:hypothetical protein
MPSFSVDVTEIIEPEPGDEGKFVLTLLDQDRNPVGQQLGPATHEQVIQFMDGFEAMLKQQDPSASLDRGSFGQRGGAS